VNAIIIICSSILFNSWYLMFPIVRCVPMDVVKKWFNGAANHAEILEHRLSSADRNITTIYVFGYSQFKHKP
jgi:hypothetical protein